MMLAEAKKHLLWQRSHSTRKTVGRKHLLQKKLYVDFTICNHLKLSLCGYGQLRYSKILYVDLGLSVKTKNNCSQ